MYIRRSGVFVPTGSGRNKVSLSDLKRFIRIEDEIKTQAKNELLAKQKVSANMVASKSDKVFFKKNTFKKKNQNSKNLNVQKKEFKKLAVVSTAQTRPLC